VLVKANGAAINAVLNVVDDDCIVQPDELGLSEDAFARLNVDAGHPAHVSPAEPPASMPALRRKIAGERLGKDLHAIIRDIAQPATPRSSWRPSWWPPTATTWSATRCSTSPRP
jgi:thymidine phosphorylase